MAASDKTQPLIRIQSPEWAREAGRFLAVGLLITGLDWSIYFAFTRLIPFFAAQPTAAKAISYAVSVLNSYLLNREWTFRSKANPWATLTPFLACSLGGLVINAVIFHIFAHSLLLSEMAALILATGTAILWNYFTSKYLVFRK